MEKDKKNIFKELLEFAGLFALAYITVLILITFFFKPVVVDGSSMYPTLTDGDLGFTNVFKRNTEGIKRFDICVIKVEDSDKKLVKRVIGLPNETVKVEDCKLYINGEYYEQDFLADDVFTNDFEITLGEDEYFVMGDNRTGSSDSRGPVYGPFTSEQIISVDIFILYPFNHFGVK